MCSRDRDKCNAFSFLETWTLLGCVLSCPDQSHCRHKEQKSLNGRQGTQAWGAPSSASDSPPDSKLEALHPQIFFLTV